MKRNTHDRGLFCAQLAWFLCSSSAELGHRGTTAAVVSAIERGGAGSNADPDLAMLLRCYELPLEKGKRAKPNVVARHRQLSARWALVPREHQQTLLARYLATERVDSKIRARFGNLAGVVLYRWLANSDEQRQHERRAVKLDAAAATTELRNRALDLSSRERAYRGARGLRPLSLWWFLRRLEQDAWAELGRMKRAEGTLLDLGSLEADAKALAIDCTRGDPPPLEEDAERACRAAHAAWYETRQQEAQRWADDEDEAPASASRAS